MRLGSDDGKAERRSTPTTPRRAGVVGAAEHEAQTDPNGSAHVGLRGFELGGPDVR
jgi:hypothetical protein